MNTLYTNQVKFLDAANWVLENEANGIETGIRTSRIVGDNYQIVLFNQRKNLLYEGFSHPNQLILKGLICRVENNKAVEVVSACFNKFFNYGEPSEAGKYFDYANFENTVHFTRKYDGTNIRPWWNPIKGCIEYATRGTLTGSSDYDEENQYVDYGRLAHNIVVAKYPVITEGFVKEYSCIFELIHPGTRVITNYGDTQDLILLAAFDLMEDCREFSFNELKSFAQYNKLNLMETWDVGIQEVQGSFFKHHLDTLQEKWHETDEEGSVIIFCDYKSEILYRLKFKNKDYVAFLRALKNCNFKFVVTMVLENKLTEWEAFKEFVYKNAFANEEVEPRFAELFDYARKYYFYLEAMKLKIEMEYNQLPAFDTQKDFALYIASNPLKSFFFEFRKATHKSDDPKTFDVSTVWNGSKLYLYLQMMYPYKAEDGHPGLFDFEFEKGILV